MTRNDYAPPTSTGPIPPPPAAAQEPTQLDRIEAKLDQLLATRPCPVCAKLRRDEEARQTERVYKVRIPASSRAQMRAEERMIQARLDAGEHDDVAAAISLRLAIDEKLQAAADAASDYFEKETRP